MQSVTAEGDKQTKRVEDAAAGIVADREQITANKADIDALKQAVSLERAVENYYAMRRTGKYIKQKSGSLTSIRPVQEKSCLIMQGSLGNRQQIQ